MDTKQLLNEWRRFLVESASSDINIELNGTKLSVYHLTGINKIGNRINNKELSPIINKNPGDRVSDILYNLNKKERNRYQIQQSRKLAIEFNVVRNILSDPYTKGTGFDPGAGDMYGRALYTCYKFNPDIAKIYGDICLKFEVDISNYIIFFEDLAKQIHGVDWRLEDQVAKALTAKGYDFKKEIDKDDFTQNSLRDLINNIVRRSVSQNKEIEDKSYLNDEDITSDTALRFTKIAKKNNMQTLFDGIIFRGDRDGPVCVVYNPTQKARLVKLGRIIDNEGNITVKWSNNLREFFGDEAKNTPDVDFQTMNDIVDETHTDDSLEKINYVYDEVLHDLEFITSDLKSLNIDTSDHYELEDLILSGFDFLNEGPKQYLETTSAKNFIDTFMEKSPYHIYISSNAMKNVLINLLSLSKYINNIKLCQSLAERIVVSNMSSQDEYKIQLILAQHDSPLVRSALLDNSELHQKALELLAQDSDTQISKNAAKKLGI